MSRLKIRITYIATILSMGGFGGFSQQTSLPILVHKFDAYRTNVLQEKLFVHTDRSSYLTGETLWFKIYYVDASLHQPLNISKVAYVEILDENKKAVIQTKVALNDNGNGSASIFLPSTLSSGHYLFRAYTNWMKNFSADVYFQQPLTIINPFTKLGLKPVKDDVQYDVQFFPEGGNLVTGLTSKVAVRVTDQTSKGIDFQGSIVDEAGVTVVNFHPLKFGLGSFNFTPSSGHTYKAVIQDPKGKAITYSLPVIHDEGYVIQIIDTTSTEIKVTVKTHFLQPLQNPAVYLLAHTRQMISVTEMRFIQDGKAEFIVKKNSLKEGITHFTIFNDQMLPVCERLYFKQPSPGLQIDIHPDQSQYATRRKITLDFYTHLNGKPDAANMSVSVYKADSIQGGQQSIANYLLLTSDLNGTIESPQYYLDSNADETRTQAIENLMLTHGWSRFTWEDILKSKNDNLQFIPEVGGHVIHGQVTEMISGVPSKNIVTYLSAPEKIIRLYPSRSREDGMIQFEMQNFFGNREVIVQTNTQHDSTYQFKLFSPFSEKHSTYLFPAFDFSEKFKNEVLQSSIHMQVQNTFYQEKNNRFVTPLIDSIPFYGKPDEKYLLDDFTRFSTMEEVMREYVPGVLVRKKKGKFHFLTLDMTNKVVFKEDPLILLDGVPVFDVDKIMAYDPRNVKKLEVMTRRYFLGVLSFGGVVSYTTYKNDLVNFQPDTRSLIVNYEGLQLQRDFFSPRYESKQARETTLPDARRLLHWSPTILTDPSGKAQLDFYTSDIAGKYVVVVQGITKRGAPASTSIVLDVKNTSNY